MSREAQQKQLPGFELDINHLIDVYALWAHEEQLLSFAAFKQLFKDGCYAYIHQAYWGCEHSPEYAQLLFAAALDRLDIPSPTAPPSSSLWQLHRLVPKGVDSRAALSPAAAGGVDAAQHPVLSPAAEPAAQEVNSSELAAEAMDVDQQELPAGETMQHLPRIGGRQQQPHPGTPHAGHVLAVPQQELQEQQQELSPLLWPDLNIGEQPQQQPQQQQQHLSVQQQQQQAAWLPDQQRPQGGSPLQQQQQQGQGRQQALGFPEDWLSSPLLLPQQAPGAGQPGADLSPTLLQLMYPSPLQQQQQGTATANALEDFLLPAAAFPAAGLAQQQLQHQQQQHHHQQQLQQQDGNEQQPLEGAAQQGQPLQSLPQQGQAPPADVQHAVGAQPPWPQQQQQQQQWVQPGLHMQGEEEDDFLPDLLAILEEGMQGQDQQQATDSGGSLAGQAGSSQQDPAAAAAGASTQPQQPPPQQYVLQIPMAVKAAAVFVLLALHESQLNYPKVPVYLPLPLLQQLAAAAAEFQAAGAGAADALQAVRVLVGQQRLLVGQFRRPNSWVPQLPAYLMPGGRLPSGLGLNTAIGVAARKAARTAARSSMQSAAVAAAARAARIAAGFDPGVQREAMFHIKTALQGLSNFKGLQSLCDEYAGARKAVFEPLLGITLPSPAPAAAQPQRPAPAQQEQGAQPVSSTNTGGRALVVQRGGSRRRRKVAMAAAAAAAAPPASSPAQANQSAPAAAAAAGAGACAAASAQLQEAGSSGGAAGVDLPELFDTRFATSLQGLANSEASRMLLLLDPYYNASKVRKRTSEARRAAKAAEEAAAAAARGRLERFKQLTMGRAGAGGDAAAAAAGGQGGQRRQQPSRSAPAAAGVDGLRQQLVEAGIFTEQYLEDVSSLRGVDGALSGAASGGGAQQVLRRAEQQRQTTVQVAQEWLRAQSALVVVDADDADDDDMP